MPLGQRMIRFIGRNLFEAAEAFGGKKIAPEHKEKMNKILDKIFQLQDDPYFKKELDERVTAVMSWIETYPEPGVISK